MIHYEAATMNPEDILVAAYDIHIHAAPDVVPRACDLMELGQKAVKARMRGLLIKDHCTSTVGRVSALNTFFNGKCRFFSAICLNPPVGFLNPVAVEAALRAGVNVIYFPTYAAANHIGIWGAGKPPTAFPLPGGFKGISILDNNENLVKESLDIIKLIAEYDAVLATGHLSPREGLLLIREARRMGVKRLLITHASESVTHYKLEEQQEAASLGALIEHSYFAATELCPNQTSIEEIAFQIKNLGCEHIILSSDLGQVGNPDPVEGFALFVNELVSLGFSREEIDLMIRENPRKLLS